MTGDLYGNVLGGIGFRSVVLAAVMLAPVAAKGADSTIDGGFGYVLGEQFDPSKARRAVEHYTYHLYEVPPIDRSYAFRWYWLTLTKDNYIRSIAGRQVFGDMTTCMNELNRVKARLESEHGRFLHDGEWNTGWSHGYSMSGQNKAGRNAELSIDCSSSPNDSGSDAGLNVEFRANWFGPDDFK